MRGLVIKNTGSWYTVLTDDDQLVDCKIKGTFRLKGIRSTNPVAVGDRVSISENLISEIEDRRNYIVRRSQNLSKQSHIIAANVDQAFLVVTVNYPQTSTTFIDRFLASAEAYRVPVVLIFNKTDRLDADELHYQQMMVQLYETIGYTCKQISAATGDGVEDLRPLLEGKITLLSGNSGVGKSTLINRLVPDANLRTAEISSSHNLGQHTTTSSRLYHLPDNTTIIDSPGIREFGLWHLTGEEVIKGYPEFTEFTSRCKFRDCRHRNDPGCALVEAVNDGKVAEFRYNNYHRILESSQQNAPSSFTSPGKKTRK